MPDEITNPTFVAMKILTAEQFKRAREKKKFTVAQLAEAMGVSESTIYKKEARLNPITKMDVLALINIRKNGKAAK